MPLNSYTGAAMIFSAHNRTFLNLAVPNVLANLVIPLASLIDLAVLGNLPDLSPLAGVALAAIVFDLMYLTLNFLRIGTTGLTAIAYGARDHEAAAAVFFRSFVMAIGLGLLLFGLQWLYRDPVLSFLASDPATFPPAQAYFAARILGAPAALGNYVTTGWLLGRHQSRAVLLITAVFSAANILGDWLLVWVWGRGAQGAGLATMLSQYLALLVGLFMVHRSWRELPAFRMKWLTSGFRPLLQLQANIMVRTFCLTATFSAFTYISSRIGTTILVANTVLERLLHMSAWFIDGYAFSLEALSGRFWGAGDEGAVRRYLKTALIWNTATIAGLILVFFFSGPFLIQLLIAHQEAAQQAVDWLPWLCITLCFSGFAYIFDGLYIGLAAGPLLRKAMLISTFLGFVPLATGALLFKNPHLLWAALLGFMVCRSFTLGRQVSRPGFGVKQAGEA